MGDRLEFVAPPLPSAECSNPEACKVGIPQNKELNQYDTVGTQPEHATRRACIHAERSMRFKIVGVSVDDFDGLAVGRPKPALNESHRPLMRGMSQTVTELGQMNDIRLAASSVSLTHCFVPSCSSSYQTRCVSVLVSFTKVGVAAANARGRRYTNGSPGRRK